MLNQNFINNEYKVERIVPGTTHPYLGAIGSKGTIPLPETLTGTISTDNAGSTAGKIVLGVGTLFLTELAVGDFIYNGDAAIRKIRYIYSDTMLELEEKFPASLSGAAIKVPKRNLYKQIVARSTGTVDAQLQEAAFEVGAQILTGGTPLAYDCSVANTGIEFTCSK